MKYRTTKTDLPVLLPFRLHRDPISAVAFGRISFSTSVLLFLVASFATSTAVAQATVPARESAVAILIKWAPLIFQGFLFNILISFLAMALGMLGGVAIGIGQISLVGAIRKTAWVVTQFFRNAPWLVLLFYAMFLLPFEFRLFGVTISFPAWIKAVIGLALPVAANVSEIVRGGVQSIPVGQWESAESLAFTRRQTLWPSNA